MAERFMTIVPENTQVLPARLESDAIGAAQDTIIGMANSAPTVAIGLSLAGLAAAAAYGSGPVIILCGIPMLIIANAYRRLNLWSANCGASFEWVGRAIDPYLGFLTGWLMIAASLIAAWSTEFTRMVGGETARLTLTSPARSMASSASQAGFGSTTAENGVAAPPRYADTADVLKTAPGMPCPSNSATSTSMSRTDAPGSSDSACPRESVQVTAAAEGTSPAATPICCRLRAK